jgi:hypothetical protein
MTVKAGVKSSCPTTAINVSNFLQRSTPPHTSPCRSGMCMSERWRRQSTSIDRICVVVKIKNIVDNEL